MQCALYSFIVLFNNLNWIMLDAMNEINLIKQEYLSKLFTLTDWHREHKEDLCKGVFWKTPQASRSRDWNWKQICESYIYYL